MEAVQAQVLSHYRSELVDRIRAGMHVLSAGGLTVKLAKEFGFCYGVERAIDLAYAARKVYPQQPIYILGEIIHNPEVNDQIRGMGIKFLSGKEKNANIDDLQKDDIVIIPAFGAEMAVMEKLRAKGCQFVDTTCGDVMSVWKRVRQYANDSVTSIIHGKAWHEETKATSSRATASGKGHYLVVFTLAETDYVCNYILHGGDKQEFLEKFKGAYSPGFDPDRDLQAIGVANQTTMLSGDSLGIAAEVGKSLARRFGGEPGFDLSNHFRSFDTICSATQERQDAVEKLVAGPEGAPDVMVVIGGYNSSNTNHLAVLCARHAVTFHVADAACIDPERGTIRFKPAGTPLDAPEVEAEDWLPAGPIVVGLTAGASTPNVKIGEAVERLLRVRGLQVEEETVATA